MAKYPIKMLRDEKGIPFIPYTSTEGLYDPSGQTLEQKLETKLETKDIRAGDNVTVAIDGNTVTISSTGSGGGGGGSTTLIDNLNTVSPGQGALDARQGKVLKDSIPTVINNLTTSTSGQGALDASQGKALKDSIPAIVDNVNTVSSTKGLSAYQGYLLNQKVVPTGGLKGQVLKKSSNSDHALEWGDAADPNAIVGDGSITKIVHLTYDEYKALEASGNVDEHTEYHIDEYTNAPGFLEDLISKILLSKHPIGSIEINLTGENPANYLGGVWEQIKDTFLLACGDKYDLGSTGGEATHTLKINEMPKHNHAVNYWVNSNLPGGIDHFLAYGNTSSAKPNRTQIDSWVEKEGGDQPHNNMPPYLAVSVWKRIG